jgi:hypothetical protein
MRAMAPVSDTSLALRSLPTMRLASASNTKGRRLALARCLLRDSRMQATPPWAAMRDWLCEFWHMLDKAPHDDLSKSAHPACIRMPLMMTGIPPCLPMTSLTRLLLNASDHIKSHAASCSPELPMCVFMQDVRRRMPSRAISSLLASSRDRIASTPQQVFRESTWDRFSCILVRISWTREEGEWEFDIGAKWKWGSGSRWEDAQGGRWERGRQTTPGCRRYGRERGAETKQRNN